MFYFEESFGGYHIFTLWSGNYFPYIILDYGLVFFCHGICPFFHLKGFFKAGRILLQEVTHLSRITGKWLWSFHLSRGSLGNTILLPILNKLSSPSQLSFMEDCHLRWFLKFHYIMIFWNFLIRGNYVFPHWLCGSGNLPLCSSEDYEFLFIYFFKLAYS
jgi:hypothetical protein